MTAFLHLALPVPVPGLFDYLPPPGATVVPGMRVRVPFGRDAAVGLVRAVDNVSEVPRERVREAFEVLDETPVFTPELMRSLAWAGEYWLGTPGEVFLGALPTWLREARAWPVLDEPLRELTPAGREALAAGSRRGKSLALLAALADGPRGTAALDVECPGWRPAARRLEAADLVLRRAGEPVSQPPEPGPELTAEQAAAIAAVAADMGRYRSFLLDGVTGSGKTEVYLGLIAQALAAGRQTLVLVPEIGLAPQTLQRLRARLGVPIEVLHSNLAEGDRARAFLRALTGRARVVIGTRSAVFTPLPQAGLIIVDEEHDSSYKQQDGFRYHARDLALVRGRELGVPVVLGSATPSLESLANAAAGRHLPLRLTRRPQARPAPRIEVLDTRGSRPAHGLGPELLARLDACVARGEQALVFRNRRGYAPVLICPACRWHAACPACDRPLTLHRGERRLLCHHCGRSEPLPAACPDCGAGDLLPHGYGTERIEDFLQARYPQVPVLRVDSETTRQRRAFERVLETLHGGGPAVLVGTQMLAKGHDLPGLTLVAISGVDEALYSVDFRAGEKLAQLIVQVSGRAGRADKPGSVVLQTWFPDHPLLASLLRHGYHHAADEMLAERRVTRLPPFSHQALLRARAPTADALAGFLAAALAALPSAPGVRALGPLPAPMPRRAGQDRGQILLEAEGRAALRGVLVPWHAALHVLRRPRAVHWSLDVDPVDLY